MTISDEKLQSTLGQCSEVSMESVEDLEDHDVAEAILLRCVYHESAEDSKDKNERDEILSSLRFRWEVFRICLDLTKNNSKLEMVAQEFAKQAFEFCDKYSRRNEFRRLCEILRGYLHSLLNPNKQSQSLVNIQSAESMQLLIDVRFDQLSTAISLELWQEAFRSIEDLHGLFVIYKKSIKAPLMISYYESLIKIFQMSGDSLFHAAAWGKLLAFVFSLPEAPSTEQLCLYCSSSVLAALSITSDYKPIELETGIDSEETEEGIPKSRVTKFTSLLGLPSVPEREDLIQSACSKLYAKYVSVEVRELAEIVQKQFFAKEDLEKFFSLASAIECNEALKNFLDVIRRGMAHRYLQQISTEMREISFCNLLKIAKSFFEVKSFFELESFLFQQNRSPSSRTVAHVDHVRQMVTFSPVFYVKSSEVSAPDSSDIAKLIQEIQALLKNVTESEIPEGLLDVSGKLRLFNLMLESERAFLAKTQKAYYQQKEHNEIIRSKKEQEETEVRNALLAAEREADASHREEERKKREHEKMYREKQTNEKADKIKLLDEVNKKLAVIKRHLDPEVYLSMSKTEILREQARLLDEAKKEIDKRFSAIGKRLDHKERALRLEEFDLIKQQYQQQQQQDKVVFARIVEDKIKGLAIKRAAIIKKSQSASSMKYFSEQFASKIFKEHEASIVERKNIQIRQYEEAKAALREKILEERYRDALKQEQDAQRTKLDEIAQKQREKEAEIERRLEQKTSKHYVAVDNVTDSKSKFIPRYKRTA